MSRFESIEVPTITLLSGRTAITREAVEDAPYLLDFIKRFPNYWVFDPSLQMWTSPLP